MIRLALVLALLALVGPAHAQTKGAPPPTPTDLLARAQAAERQHDPRSAERLYQQAVALAPTARLARRARARLRWLRARSEGDYAPLAALMKFQTTPRRTLDDATLRAFEQTVHAFPQGRVRCESLAVIAAGYLYGTGDARSALVSYRAWRDCPGISDGDRVRATAGAAAARERLDGIAASLDEIDGAGLGARPEAVRLRSQIIGRTGSWLCIVALVSFLLLGFASGGWAGLAPSRLRRALSLRRVGVAVWVLATPLLLMWFYDRRVAMQLMYVAAACTVVVLLAALIGAGLETKQASTGWRNAMATLAAVATFAGAFIALYRTRLLFDIMLALAETR